jgi:hypothetical protein
MEEILHGGRNVFTKIILTIRFPVNPFITPKWFFIEQRIRCPEYFNQNQNQFLSIAAISNH